ncbi:MAG TPA: hypothetical protein VGM63_07325 [Mucilaginibacter sp.]|jgi:hypothetical protein
MTPRSLFVIIVKIIGIYLIVSAATIIPQWTITIYDFAPQFGKDNAQSFLSAAFFLLLTAVFYILILRYCFFKTDWIIDKLHLDKGFSEEKFEINIHRSTVLKIAVIVIGGVMAIDSLPLFCKQVFSYIQMSRINSGFKEMQSSGWIVFYLVKFFVGFSLINANRPIVNFIDRKRKGPVTSQNTME